MERVKNWLKTLKKYLVFMFTISFYMLSIYYFFINPKILIWLVFSIFFFILAHYFIIESKKSDIWNLIISILVACLLVLFLSGFDNFFYVAGIVIFHLAIIFLFYDVYDEAYNRIVINSWKLFTMWWKMFSLTISLVFALSFLWTYRTFNLTCDKIYTGIQKASTFAANYFDIKLPKLSKDVKVKDVISKIGSTSSWNVVFTWNRIWLSQALSFSFWKNVVINQIMANKKILDKNICQIIVSNIREKYNKPGFQFVVMFLIFMLFYPIVRVVILLLAVINWFMFQLSRLAWIYKYVKIVEEVEMIE